MELGEDKDLKFVMACADYIPPLQPFSGSCKPVWLFVAAGNTKNICSASKNISPAPGEVVSVMDGPNVTQLRSKVVEECDKEARVAAGSTTRDTLAIQEAVPGEGRWS